MRDCARQVAPLLSLTRRFARSIGHTRRNARRMRAERRECVTKLGTAFARRISDFRRTVASVARAALSELACSGRA
jgi:hypothetical protein